MVEQETIFKNDLNITHLDRVVMKICHDNFILVVDSNEVWTCKWENRKIGEKRHSYIIKRKKVERRVGWCDQDLQTDQISWCLTIWFLANFWLDTHSTESQTLEFSSRMKLHILGWEFTQYLLNPGPDLLNFAPLLSKKEWEKHKQG